MPRRRRQPTPYAETQRGLTRYVWRFEGEKYRTAYSADPDEAYADAIEQIAQQMKGTWRDRTGPKMLLEEWIDVWRELRDVEPTSTIRDKYFVEAHILPEFQERELGSLTFEEIEEWEKAIQTRISIRGTPFAPATAGGARDLLSTILADAVHAHKIDWNPAARRKGRRGRVRAKGRRGPAHGAAKQANVITPVQAICFAERCALLSGQDIDFVMNIFAPWTGVRWGELMAVEGWDGKESPLQLPTTGIATYALDWQLLEIGGKVEKAPPKDGSYRTLDIPPFLADLLRWAVKNQQPSCACPPQNGRPVCKGDDQTEAHYLFLGPRGGHPRRSNYADRFITPAAEGLYPKRKGTRRPVYVTSAPWPGLPIRQGNRKNKAANMADGTWPNLLGKFKPHDDRHTHATWLDLSNVPKVLQMDRRGHQLPGMDAVYNHVTPEMRQQLCDFLQQLWHQGIAERYKLAPRSAVPLLNDVLIAHEKTLSPANNDERTAQADDSKRDYATKPPEVLARARRQQANQGHSRG
jgi:integrase